MSTYASPLSSGKTSPKGFLRVFGKVFSGSGVIESAALTVSAQGTPDMTVKVSGSALNDNAVFIHTDGTFIQAWNESDVNVSILANASGVTKTDAIVAYVDLTDYDASNANNPDCLKFIAVRRSGSDTGAPTTGEIQATAVSTNPYFVRAEVSVANGASSINSGNITNKTVNSRVDGQYVKLASVARDKLASGALPEIRISLGANAAGGTPGTSFVTLDPSRTTINFEKLVSGASAAYFYCTCNNSAGSQTSTYQLYNVTDGAAISGSSITQTLTSAREVRSSDILANLPTTSKEIAVQYKVTSGAVAFYNVTLVIQY